MRSNSILELRCVRVVDACRALVATVTVVILLSGDASLCVHLAGPYRLSGLKKRVNISMQDG